MGNDRIKVLIIEPVSDMGGVSNYILTLVNGINSDNFDIRVGASGNGLLFTELRNSGSAIPVSLPIDYKLSTFITSVRALIKYCKDEKIDIIFANTLKAGFIATSANLFLSKKLVYLAHGWRFSQKISFCKKIIVYLIDFFVCHSSDWITVLTDFDIKLGKKFFLITSNRINLAPTHIDIVDSEYYKKEITKDREKIVGNISRMAFPKNPEEFIRIAKLVILQKSDIKFIWFGGGDLESFFEKKIKEYNLQDYVFWGGDLPHKNIYNEFAKFDVFLLTSEFEGLPISLIEAMSFGVPIVSSRVGGIPSIIKDNETGYLYKSGDVEDASKYVLKCLNFSDAEKETMIKAQKKLISENYSPATKLGKIYEKIWNQLLFK